MKFLIYILFIAAFASCSVNKQINKQAEKLLFSDSSIRQGHIGISVFEPSTGKYLYNHNADKYFIPASNTKLFTWYAGMKYLGDSLVGFKYAIQRDSLFISPQGDPTFLHTDFKEQRFFNYLKTFGEKVFVNIDFLYRRKFSDYGKGWAGDDYESSYMAERSIMPIYGNIAKFQSVGNYISSTPEYFSLNLNQKIIASIIKDGKFAIARERSSNEFDIYPSPGKESTKQEIPFFTDNGFFNIMLLTDTLKISYDDYGEMSPVNIPSVGFKTQSTDSLLKPMMHRSDNFFAEQTLLMVSNEQLGFMSDEAIIDSLLKKDLKDIPQKPRWVDGSGLSRYNLFTPQDFVWLLNKTKNEFDWERIKNILPTGGEGTLSSYYKEDAGFIYAKTGTLSNNCALSGYLITKKNKLLIFSVLVNNYPTGATPVRRAVEKFIKSLREKY